MGLLEALTQYIKDAIPGGSLNPEQPAKLSGLLDAGKKQAQYIGGLLDPNSPISKDAQNWHKRTQIGLADQLAGRQTPEAEAAYQTMMQAAGMAPVGMIAWHGSPHKFDKFDLSKIGTGEGAQAYGHGLYLAEHPEVAKEYQRALGRPDSSTLTKAQDIAAWAHSTGVKGNDDAVRVLEDEIARLDAYGKFDGKKLNRNHYMEALAMVKQNAAPSNGNLYKTDIPDEAVARFLDWDKPFAKQSPEVKKILKESGLVKQYKQNRSDYSTPQATRGTEQRGQNYLALLEHQLGGEQAASAKLKELGIPGIRYLDGGSRGTGTGTSNFVAFDPEMIRILERNGQPTGLQPWKPGEWK